MYSTLIELERIHQCPMVVRDAYSHSWYLIVGKDEESHGGFIYKTKMLKPNTYAAEVGTPVSLIYGGYNKWVYVGPATQEEGITPEDQKRIREIERKRSNDRITRDLQRDKQRKKIENTPKTNAGKTIGKVIQFKRDKKEE